MQSKVSSVSEQQDMMLREAEKQNSQLQAMVTHYKTIIEETVSWKYYFKGSVPLSGEVCRGASL